MKNPGGSRDFFLLIYLEYYSMKKLFLIHLGYSDDINGGVFEQHTNIFVVADDFDSAQLVAKRIPIVIEKKMHIDGMQLIEKVEGFDIVLTKSNGKETNIVNRNYGELTKGKQ